MECCAESGFLSGRRDLEAMCVMYGYWLWFCRWCLLPLPLVDGQIAVSRLSRAWSGIPVQYETCSLCFKLLNHKGLSLSLMAKILYWADWDSIGIQIRQYFRFHQHMREISWYLIHFQDAQYIHYCIVIIYCGYNWQNSDKHRLHILFTKILIKVWGVGVWSFLFSIFGSISVLSGPRELHEQRQDN